MTSPHRHYLLLLAVLALVRCSPESPRVSSGSHWFACQVPEDCQMVSGTCSSGGICVDQEGTPIEGCPRSAALGQDDSCIEPFVTELGDPIDTSGGTGGSSGPLTDPCVEYPGVWPELCSQGSVAKEALVWFENYCRHRDNCDILIEPSYELCVFEKMSFFDRRLSTATDADACLASQGDWDRQMLELGCYECYSPDARPECIEAETSGDVASSCGPAPPECERWSESCGGGGAACEYTQNVGGCASL